MVDNRHVVGTDAERTAELFLKKKHYKIIDRNWRYKNHHEIDIIAGKGDSLVAVEVRSLTQTTNLKPFETINRAKIQRIRQALEIFAQINNRLNQHLQVDAISVSIDSGEVLHFEAIDIANL